MNENTINNDVTMAGESERALLASRYRIIRQLGQGGMGSVWLAEDTQLDGKLFAVKMLPSILVANKRAFNQLKAEALVAMKLVHPNIVQIRAFEENGNNPFLVMDYIDGETLDDYLANRMSDGAARGDARPPENIVPAYGRASVPASRGEESGVREGERPREPYQESGVGEEEVVRLLKPIAEALDYAHTEGVVHRDIKPANVMIRKDGRPFIMDFGIAREIQETMTRVTGKMSSGTLMYMSPEQLNGDTPKPSQDVYSFAAMVYECLKGEPPFSRGNIEYQIMNKEPEPLTYGRASVPAHGRASVPASRDQELGGRASRPVIADSVMAALAKKPEDRPKSCVDVLKKNVATVQSVGKNREGERPREPQSEQRVRTTSQGNTFGKIVAIAVFALGFVVGVWYWQDAKGKDESRIALELKAEEEREAVEAARSIADEKAKAEKAEAERKQKEETAQEAEARVADIMVEATVKKNQVLRIDDGDGFERRKTILSDLLTKATSYGKAKQWDKAAFNFTNYVDGCNKLITLDGERKIAKEKHSAAVASQLQAEKVESSKYTSARWGAASDVMKKASEHFAQMEFSEAKGFYESAAKQFKLCISEAKTERERQVLEALATDPGNVLKKDLFTPKLKEYEWICTEISRVQGELSSLLTSCTEIHPSVRAKREDLNELFEQFVTLMEKEGLGDKARKAWEGKGWAGSEDVIEKPSSDEPSYFTYEVRSGDNLMRILEKYRIKRSAWREISKINKLISGRVSVGQKLKIPKSLLGSADREEKVYEGNASPNHGDRRTLRLPGGATMTMIYVAPGSFMMGSPSPEEERNNDETQHDVTLTKGYWLGETEVTQAQWESVMGNNPSYFKGMSRPVERVSWEDCQTFIAKVNREVRCQFGGDARLPTEAEWEYACRAGTQTAYSWGNSLNGDKANCDGNYPYGTTIKGTYKRETVNVCSYSPNAWGFYDMHGNVWEWCQDWYDEYQSDAVTDPTGSASGDSRVLRGGGWYVIARSCRSAHRGWEGPGYRNDRYGFRLCCSVGLRD